MMTDLDYRTSFAKYLRPSAESVGFEKFFFEMFRIHRYAYRHEIFLLRYEMH